MDGRYPFGGNGQQGHDANNPLQNPQLRAALGLGSLNVDELIFQQRQQELQRDLQLHQMMMQGQARYDTILQEQQRIQAVGEHMHEIPDLQRHYHQIMMQEQAQLQQQEEMRRRRYGLPPIIPGTHPADQAAAADGSSSEAAATNEDATPTAEVQSAESPPVAVAVAVPAYANANGTAADVPSTVAAIPIATAIPGSAPSAATVTTAASSLHPAATPSAVQNGTANTLPHGNNAKDAQPSTQKAAAAADANTEPDNQSSIPAQPDAAPAITVAGTTAVSVNGPASTPAPMPVSQPIPTQQLTTAKPGVGASKEPTAKKGKKQKTTSSSLSSPKSASKAKAKLKATGKAAPSTPKSKSETKTKSKPTPKGQKAERTGASGDSQDKAGLQSPSKPKDKPTKTKSAKRSPPQPKDAESHTASEAGARDGNITSPPAKRFKASANDDGNGKATKPVSLDTQPQYEDAAEDNASPDTLSDAIGNITAASTGSTSVMVDAPAQVEALLDLATASMPTKESSRAAMDVEDEGHTGEGDANGVKTQPQHQGAGTEDGDGPAETQAGTAAATSQQDKSMLNLLAATKAMEQFDDAATTLIDMKANVEWEESEQSEGETEGEGEREVAAEADMESDTDNGIDNDCDAVEQGIQIATERGETINLAGMQSVLPQLPEEPELPLSPEEFQRGAFILDPSKSRKSRRKLSSKNGKGSSLDGASKRPEVPTVDYPYQIDPWWPSISSIRKERKASGRTVDEDDFEDDPQFKPAPNSQFRANMPRIREKFATEAEPGVLEKVPPCRVHRMLMNKRKSVVAPEHVHCFQVTELYPNNMMVCCSQCGTWRHAECGGHYKPFSVRECISTPLTIICDRCHEEEPILREHSSGRARIDKQRTEQLRRALATSATMRQASFSKHGGTYKWPLGSVSATHIGGHTRSVHSRHDKAEKQWADMATRLGRNYNTKGRDRTKVRTKELERLLVSVEDAEGHTDRHNMMLFLLEDSQRDRPVGFEKSMKNIFDPEEDDGEDSSDDDDADSDGAGNDVKNDADGAGKGKKGEIDDGDDGIAEQASANENENDSGVNANEQFKTGVANDDENDGNGEGDSTKPELTNGNGTKEKQQAESKDSCLSDISDNVTSTSTTTTTNPSAMDADVDVDVDGTVDINTGGGIDIDVDIDVDVTVDENLPPNHPDDGAKDIPQEKSDENGKEGDTKPKGGPCARSGCPNRHRFDSVFCSDACGVSAMESDLLRTFFYVSDMHPALFRA